MQRGVLQVLISLIAVLSTHVVGKNLRQGVGDKGGVSINALDQLNRRVQNEVNKKTLRQIKKQKRKERRKKKRLERLAKKKMKEMKAKQKLNGGNTEQIGNNEVESNSISTARPTLRPSRKLSTMPTTHPTGSPSQVPTVTISTTPTQYPTKQPTTTPSYSPSHTPSVHPTVASSSDPSQHPTVQPTIETSSDPSQHPTVQPTKETSSDPSQQHPTIQPTKMPSNIPTKYSSNQPSVNPSSPPSQYSSHQPSTKPSMAPSQNSSDQPSTKPSVTSSLYPSDQPSITSLDIRTAHFSAFPSTNPTEESSVSPTHPTTGSPSKEPTTSPSITASESPTVASSVSPTIASTGFPSMVPSSPLVFNTLSVCGGITEEERSKSIKVKLKDSSPHPTHPFAENWIINVDGRGLCPDDSTLIQRYVLAAFYFDTGGEGWKKGNNRPDEWLSSESECDWFGLSCNKDDFINKIYLGDNNLKGMISKEIGLLESLRELRLYDNSLTGPFPILPESLFDVKLYNNRLIGNLPDKWPRKLIRLQIYNNDLNGSINSIATALNMRVLELHDNKFSGQVSNHFGSLTSLTTFSIHGNDLSGRVPLDICLLRKGAFPGNKLSIMTADCASQRPKIQCQSIYLFGDIDCCSECY